MCIFHLLFACYLIDLSNWMEYSVVTIGLGRNKRIASVVLNFHIQRLVAHLMFLLVGRKIIRHGLDMKTCDTWEVLFSIHLTNNQRQYILC